MEKDQQDINRAQFRWTIMAGIGATLAFIVTGIIGIWSLIKQQDHEQQLEFKKAILNERLATYKEACRTAGAIILFAEIKSDSLPHAFNQFEKLYWGEMGLIEDEKVVEAGKRFRLACGDYQRSARQEDDLNKLKTEAADFTMACKVSSKDGWNEILQL